MSSSMMKKLNGVLRKKSVDGDTKLGVMQPLNEIKSSSIEYNEEDSDNVLDQSCICDICQIPEIVGNCNKCGIHQYGELFDISIRRRH